MLPNRWRPPPIEETQLLTRDEILSWLRERKPSRIRHLYELANRVRSQHVGDAVHMRGLIEISNRCVRQCAYCGLRAHNHAVTRYRMKREEIIECARLAKRLGYGTVVMQAGEDPALTGPWIAGIVRQIKSETGLAITLSLGERDEEDLRLWKLAGADRYLLRFETSDPALFAAIHPVRRDGDPDRIELLSRLKSLGYEAGGGIMVGIPGQSYASIASDILAFRGLDLDMIGIGPYIPHPATPLGTGALRPPVAEGEQVPATEEMVLKVVALTRIVCPDANLPSTTALATINKKEGRRHGLLCGANVVMPNLTPVRYRAMYEIYPAKSCIDESAQDCSVCLRAQIRSIGREVGTGPGGRGQALLKKPASAVPMPQLVNIESMNSSS
jgi:biotin synthase